MKTFALMAVALAGALAGCTGNPVTIANNALARLAKNDIPAACAIVKVAEGYYSTVVGPPTPVVLNAEAGVAVICDNPPTDLASAFGTLLSEWTVIENATKTPAAN